MYHIIHPSMKLHMDTSIANRDLYDVLNYSLNRHMEFVQQIQYEKFTVQLASVGLTQALPN